MFAVGPAGPETSGQLWPRIKGWGGGGQGLSNSNHPSKYTISKQLVALSLAPCVFSTRKTALLCLAGFGSRWGEPCQDSSDRAGGRFLVIAMSHCCCDGKLDRLSNSQDLRFKYFFESPLEYIFLTRRE